MKTLATITLMLAFSGSVVAEEPMKLTNAQMDKITAGAQPEVVGVFLDSVHTRNLAWKELQRDIKDAKDAGIEIDPIFVAERRQAVKEIKIDPNHNLLGEAIQQTR